MEYHNPLGHGVLLSHAGHYISDVYDIKKQTWLTYNDLDVSRTQESMVQRDRDRSGYIFFYMHKCVVFRPLLSVQAGLNERVVINGLAHLP